MTSKTSLFNKGIYKSTLRRFVWGAVVYFVVLFMATSMAIMFDVDIENSWHRTMAQSGSSLLLTDVYLFLPLVIDLFVPTVVALLLFRFIHSKKASIFVHSLPVSRTANYISTLAAAFTLMVVPVILNGIILLIMSCAAYGDFFDVASCFVWMGMNLLTVFLMFSVSVFAAMLTGNSFALIGINALVHGFVILVAVCFSQLCDVFLFGYFNVNNLVTAATKWNFVYYVLALADNLSFGDRIYFDAVTLTVMLLLALGIYVVGWILYRKRRMETAEDVAAFRCLNPIYKYMLTFIAALAGFGLFGYMMEIKPLLPIVVSTIVAVLVYFAAEMILKKSFRIWKSWKGLAGFAAVFAAMICVFAFTSFFGYETRVPNAEDVESVAIYEYYYQDEPWLSEPEIIDYAIKVHEETVQRDDIYTVKKYEEEYRSGLHIRYKLKNGNMMVRRYPVTQNRICEILTELYKIKNYRTTIMGLFSDDIGRFNRVNFNGSYDMSVQDEAKIEEFVAALKKDVLSLDYMKMLDGQNWAMNISIEYIPKNQLETDADTYDIHAISQTINANFRNTLKWIRENGYLDNTFNDENRDLAIIPVKQWGMRNKTEADARNSYGRPVAVAYEVPRIEDFPDAVIISEQEQKDAIREYVISKGEEFIPDKEYSYYIVSIGEENQLHIQAAFYENTDEIMKLLK